MKQEFNLNSVEVMAAAKEVVILTLEKLCNDSERYVSASELAQRISQPHLRNFEPYKSFNDKYGALTSPLGNVDLVVRILYEEGRLVRARIGQSVGYRPK